MKKIIIAFISIFTMMICIAQPLIVHAITQLTEDDSYVYEYDYETSPNPNNWFSSLQSDLNAENLSYDPLYYLRIRHGNSNESRTTTIFFTEGEFDFTDNVLTLSNLKLGSNNYARLRHCFRASYMSSSSNSSNNIDDIYIDFTNHTCKYTISGGSLSDQYHVSDRDWYKINTNCPDGIPNQGPVLDLDVTFNPSMTGTVTRKGTANGADITYNYLNLNIKNYGDNAQWLFCIVPHGQSLTFPEAIINTPQGFIGSPTYVYIADEWIDWTNGLTGITGNYGGIDMEMLYSPCAWHTLITGSDRTYRINWDMMKLTKDVSYDCVVYGMINEEPVNASSSGTGLGCWTVKSALSGVTEVYRSTFTMPNPPEFNPNSVDEGNLSHPWDPDIDNTDLFNHGSVYKDANGNLVIKGSSWSSDGSGGSFYSGSGNPINVNQAFGNTFGFFNGLLNLLPRDYRLVIFFGVVAIVAIAIIKAVK